MKCKLVAVLFTLLMAAIAIANAAETKFTGAPAKSQEVLSADWTAGYSGALPDYAVNQLYD